MVGSLLLAKALFEAHKSGVKVWWSLTRGRWGEKYTSATFVANAGIPTYIDDRHTIAHNKIMIIDQETLIIGSLNFTKAAEEKNAENLLVIHGNKSMIEAYK